jgi:hypothetical protein
MREQIAWPAPRPCQRYDGHVMKRLVVVLVVMLVLDGVGAFPPEPTCQFDQVGDYSCLTLVQKAIGALPADWRSSIVTIALVGPPPCFGYCPLPALAAVIFTFADPTRTAGHTKGTVAFVQYVRKLVAVFDGGG